MFGNVPWIFSGATLNAASTADLTTAEALAIEKRNRLFFLLLNILDHNRQRCRGHRPFCSLVVAAIQKGRWRTVAC